MYTRRRLAYVLLAVVLALQLGACGKTKGNTEIALITTVDSAQRQRIEQSVQNGIDQYTAESGMKAAQYAVSDTSEEAYLNAVDEAVDAGAKIILCAAHENTAYVYKAMKKHRSTYFISIGAEPHEEGADKPEMKNNTETLLFSEEQAGYLAGYAAVMEGYRNLGFLGGSKSDTSKRYGTGFLQGMEEASEELSLTSGETSLMYSYLGSNELTPAHMSKALEWYQDGVQVIFAPGDEIGTAVIKAAEATEGKVILGDVDRSEDSAKVVTCALNCYQNAVYQLLKQYATDQFDNGKVVRFGAAEDGVALDLNASKFDTFTQDQYQTIYKKISDDEVQVTTDDITDKKTHVTITVT